MVENGRLYSRSLSAEILRLSRPAPAASLFYALFNKSGSKSNVVDVLNV